MSRRRDVDHWEKQNDEGYLPDGSNPIDEAQALRNERRHYALQDQIRRARLESRELDRKELPYEDVARKAKAQEQRERIMSREEEEAAHFNAGLPGGTNYDGGE